MSLPERRGGRLHGPRTYPQRSRRIAVPTYRIDADTDTAVEIVASRIAPGQDEIRFERRVNGEWSIQAADPRDTIKRILQRFVESDGSVRWISVARGLLTDAPGPGLREGSAGMST